jgi:carboxypeptidase family protein
MEDEMRARVGIALLATLGFVAGVVYGCGGSSSSSTSPSTGGGGGFSGGSGAVVQGQIVRNQSASLGESGVIVVLRTALGVGLAEAAVGDPLAGATVNLLNSSLVIVATTTTDSAGNFQFTGVAPGTYTIQVVDASNVPIAQDLTSTSSVTVGVGDVGTIVGTVTVASDSGAPLFTVTSVHVVAANVNDLLQNDAQVCHAISIATAAGVSPLVVIQARQAGGGHGWGQIAHQFGVPPSVLGNQSCSETQIADVVNAAGGHGHGNGNAKGKGKGKS